MNNGTNEEHESQDDNEEIGIIDVAFEYLTVEAPNTTARALTGIGFALLAIADQMRQSNVIRSAEVFGYTNINEDGTDEDKEEGL